MKFCIILGTRPEIIKLSPIIRLLKEKRRKFFIIHTNQHYSRQMDQIFFKELKLKKPKYNLGHSNIPSHGKMTGAMLTSIEQVLLKERPTHVLVQGDTNTALAGALSASKLHIPVAHIEAGLRSYDRTMPEEINRVLIDHISDYLFCPTKNEKTILLDEGIHKSKIFITGNTIVDAVYHYSKQIKKNSTTIDKKYILLTLHRPASVDSKLQLRKHILNLETLSKKLKIPIVFPIHPRTKARIDKFKIRINPKYIELIDPVGFLQMLQYEMLSQLIITDSGGLQEEACILGVPCITLRENTERPETLTVGANILVGSNKNKLLKESLIALKKKKKWENPFGKGNTAEQIIKTLI